MKGYTEHESNNVERVKEKILNYWKEINNEIEKLPAFSYEDNVDKQLRSWNLIDEDPMPFYFFCKKETD